MTKDRQSVQIVDFAHKVGQDIFDYQALHRWSIDNKEAFWSWVWDYCLVEGYKGDSVFKQGAHMVEDCFFPEARLNFARNLLTYQNDQEAIVFYGEDRVRKRLSWRNLYNQVSSLQQYFRRINLQPGDRVAALVTHTPETIIAMLATTSLGGVWSSCSPDFGVSGVVDRFGQIAPRVLICVEGYFYNGKWYSLREKILQIRDALPSVEYLIILPYGAKSEEKPLPNSLEYQQILSDFPAQIVEFVELPFDHPLYILYSSGTTGVPKCIVHRAGGVLLQHLKEHRLHSDINSGDRVFYYTTCGWMMWNWHVSALASGATLLIYEGSAVAPALDSLWRFAADENITFFGTSAKYIDNLRKNNFASDGLKLEALRMIASTGSPLLPENYDYIYNAIKKDIHIASISGGTDILGCFMLGNPAEQSVPRGQLQCAGLGMDVQIWDAQTKQSITQKKGELVCCSSFPSMPLMFWNDPEKKRYKSAYFDMFDNVWAHGDFAERTAEHGFVIYGRSDAILNPGGVRIGTAEIYRQVEQFSEVSESLCIGQSWQGDVRVILFVKMKEGSSLDDVLIVRMKKKIKQETSPRHVPARVLEVPDIPRTRSGKIMEILVRDIINGQQKNDNLAALANPNCLQAYYDIQKTLLSDR